jgi:DNA-binding transcriptional MocR family regulator
VIFEQAKGSWFEVTGACEEDVCFRLTFASAPKHRLGEGIRRFGESLRAVL